VSSPTALTGPDPRRFLSMGSSRPGIPITRVLQIGEKTHWVAPDVSVTGLAIRVKVTAAGY